VDGWRRPEQGRRCFDQLPATVERLLTGTTDGPPLELPLCGSHGTAAPALCAAGPETASTAVVVRIVKRAFI